MKIKSVSAIEILDSRGNPTIETEIILEDGSGAKASVPSGASTGKYEAIELRDNDPEKFGGKGVLTAVKNVNGEIAAKMIGMDAADQVALDKAMISLDGTENKSRLGANAILSVSLAVARAEAKSEKKPLYEYLTKFNPDFSGKFIMPVPMMNIVNGGRHANWTTDIQEYMILPVGAKNIAEAIETCSEIYHALKEILESKSYSATVGDEGGFAPNVSSNEEPLSLIAEAIRKSNHSSGNEIAFGIDAAASEFFENGTYKFKKENKSLSPQELVDFYKKIKAAYPVISIEDPFAEDEWQSFSEITASFKTNTQIVGDDLYTTNITRLQKGIGLSATNAILIKPNQIGTLTETIETILLARKNNMKTIISHRSGETEDAFIADLAVGMGAGQIKAGAPARGERVAKYDRLIEIEKELKGNSEYYKLEFGI